MENENENLEGTTQRSMVDDAKAAAEDLRKATAELRAENDRAEKLRATEILSGRAEGGKEVKEKEETPEEYADKVMGGEGGN